MKHDDRRDAGRNKGGSAGKRDPQRPQGATALGAGFGPGGYGGYGQASPPGSDPAAVAAGDSWSPATPTHGLDASESAPEPGSPEPGSSATTASAPSSTQHTERREASPTGANAGGVEPSQGSTVDWQRAAITAGDIMTRDLRSAREETTAAEIARVMKEENCGVVPVVDADGVLVGMVTDRDLVLRVAAAGKPFETTPASEVMTNEVEAVTADEELEHVIGLMGRKQVRRIPVVDRDDQLLGIISMSDVANRADYEDELEEALERVSSKRGFWSRLG